MLLKLFKGLLRIREVSLSPKAENLNLIVRNIFVLEFRGAESFDE